MTSGESRGGAKSDSDDCPHTRVVWAVSEETLELFSLMLSMCKICWGTSHAFLCACLCVFLPFSFTFLPFCFAPVPSSPLCLPRLSYPSTSKDTFAADYHQKVVLRFSLTSTTTHTPVTVHQAFVRLVRSGSQQEVFFITEQDKQGGGYTFEMVRHMCVRALTLKRAGSCCQPWLHCTGQQNCISNKCFTVELFFSRQLMWWEHSVTLFSSSLFSLSLSHRAGCEQGWKGVLQL